MAQKPHSRTVAPIAAFGQNLDFGVQQFQIRADTLQKLLVAGDCAVDRDLSVLGNIDLDGGPAIFDHMFDAGRLRFFTVTMRGTG
jgi:hypothetical protein